ncbi:MAG TPA: hypothetical protein PLU53_06615 [Bacteroidia bacterium]|nr:hypothetical protein [Bacteroidia bacterium]
MRKQTICLFSVFTLLTVFANAQKSTYKVSLIGFYNLENFYDTINDPKVSDEEFLPEGSKHYTGEVYLDKINHLSEVLSQVGTDKTPDGLALIGCAEIENEAVLKDLCRQPSLIRRNYQVVHYDSPDERGVDVALLYNPKYFTPKFSEPLNVLLYNLDSTIRKTRDVLYVYGMFAGEPLHVFVNHWPSRRGGEEVSAPGRASAARVCKHKIDSITALNPDAKIVVMGDLNDDPVSPSVAVVLGAKGEKEKVQRGGLFNPWVSMYKQGIGTLAYNDSWNLFDQIMISFGFINQNQDGFFFQDAKIFNKPWMVQTDGRYKGYPKRTYDFDKYAGGYSDHFPTYLIMLQKVK